jgi:uncharacterized protein YndB with AHSA1/START domain
MNRDIAIGKAELLIRKPIAEVFEAFVNPAITTQFWFTQSSGRLETGQQIKWEWEMYSVSAQVNVKTIEANKRILMEWTGYSGLTPVEWIFTAHPNDTTFVSVSESGFTGTDDEIVQQALGSTGGFTMVLAGAKAWLEHHIHLNLVLDRFPDGKPA